MTPAQRRKVVAQVYRALKRAPEAERAGIVEEASKALAAEKAAPIPPSTADYPVLPPAHTRVDWPLIAERADNLFESTTLRKGQVVTKIADESSVHVTERTVYTILRWHADNASAAIASAKKKMFGPSSD
jgi:hypothetical protein